MQRVSKRPKVNDPACNKRIFIMRAQENVRPLRHRRPLQIKTVFFSLSLSLLVHYNNAVRQDKGNIQTSRPETIANKLANYRETQLN